MGDDQSKQKDGKAGQPAAKEVAKQQQAAPAVTKNAAPTASAAPKRADGQKELVDGKKHCKIVLVGDTAVGKSCLIENYLHNAFSDDYEPTVLDIYRGPKNINKEMVELEIHDTSGDEHVAQNRKVVYKDADLFLLCCNSVYQSTVDNISKWKAEIREVEQEVPIVLIATKKDLRELAPQ